MLNRSQLYVAPLAGALGGVVFAANLWLEPSASLNSLYAGIVLLTIWAGRDRCACIIAGGLSVLIAADAWIHRGMTLPAFLTGPVAAIGMVWLAALIVCGYRRRIAVCLETDHALQQSMQKLDAQTSLATIGKMAAVVAHEVRNPLAGIRGAMQMVGRRQANGSADQRVVGEVIARVDALNEIVDDLLRFAAPRPPRLAPVAIADVVAETVRLARSDPRFDAITIEVDDADLRTHADREQLTQVLLNVMINGAQAMSEGGVIAVSARRDGDWDEVRVADNGPGMPAPVRARLFEPFFTTKHRGTGLGLATARQVLSAHGGSMTIECPAAGGTVVAIRLPVKTTSGVVLRKT